MPVISTDIGMSNMLSNGQTFLYIMNVHMGRLDKNTSTGYWINTICYHLRSNVIRPLHVMLLTMKQVNTVYLKTAQVKLRYFLRTSINFHFGTT